MAIYGYVAKGKPWNFQGAKNVEDCNTSREVMKKAGLDWTVAKCELVAKMPTHDIYAKEKDSFIMGNSMYKTCPNAFATYRTDYNIPLGIVKERYTPVQNIEAFKFFDTAIGKNSAIWQTAGYFGNGERIFVSAKLPKNILVMVTLLKIILFLLLLMMELLVLKFFSLLLELFVKIFSMPPYKVLLIILVFAILLLYIIN